jgi:hypothetical protein
MEELYEAKEGILYELYRFEANEMWTGPPGGFVQNKGKLLLLFAGHSYTR